jgi:hypothetical protein
MDHPKTLPAPAAPLASRTDPSIYPMRLVVLVPGQGLETLALAQWLASPVSLHQPSILFLSVVQSLKEEPCARLQLSDLIALTSGFPVKVESELILGKNWVDAVCEVWQPGDLVICYAGQTVSVPDAARYPLWVALSNRLDASVFALAGFYRESLRRPRTRATEVAWWGVALALVAAFGVLQIWISQNVIGWAHQILLIFSVLAEIGLLWIWNQAW